MISGKIVFNRLLAKTFARILYRTLQTGIGQVLHCRQIVDLLDLDQVGVIKEGLPRTGGC